MTTSPGGRDSPAVPGQDARRWIVLVCGLAGLIAACAFQYGLPFLVPAFRASGLTLTQASTMVSAPILGVLCALVVWGAIADRFGERWVLAGGLAGAAAALLAASLVSRHQLVLAPVLFVAGASAACVQVASGRLILGWFPPTERGRAMGLRQTGQPLGVGLAALTLPHLGGHSVSAAMGFLAGCCAFAALVIAAGVRDVHRDASAVAASGSPYRGSYLWRVHLAGSLMVVPQFGVAAFAFDYLVSDRGWSAGTAGPLLALAQVGGAASRLGTGWWSDRDGSRLRPMRTLTLGTALSLLVLAAAAFGGWGLAAAALAVASVITVSTNGLSFTAVAERAGQAWAGRALGIHNTAQNITAAATPPLVAMVITWSGPAHGYAAGFSTLVLFPLLAAACIPVAAERQQASGRRPAADAPAGRQDGSAAACESKPGSH